MPEVTGEAPITLGAAFDLALLATGSVAPASDIPELATGAPITLGALVEPVAFDRPATGAFAKPARRLPAADCTLDDIDTTDPCFFFAFGLAFGCSSMTSCASGDISGCNDAGPIGTCGATTTGATGNAGELPTSACCASDNWGSPIFPSTFLEGSNGDVSSTVQSFSELANPTEQQPTSGFDARLMPLATKRSGTAHKALSAIPQVSTSGSPAL
mmetsp:Transcript_12572/g.20746  ORF Transcript_12572/g.20746 Transcript_12572/m.20746 type:complete len:215 (+) Transcript_12572:425-1069(+)